MEIKKGSVFGVSLIRKFVRVCEIKRLQTVIQFNLFDRTFTVTEVKEVAPGESKKETSKK